MARKVRIVALYGVLLAWLFAVVLPVVWVFTNSLRSSREFVESPFGPPWLLVGSPYADRDEVETPWAAAKSNYDKAWTKSKFSRFFFNSVFVTSISLAGILVLSSMAAYALARVPFRGGRAVFLYFVCGLMVPAHLLVVPLFFQFSAIERWGTALMAPLGLEVKLHDTFTGLITLYIALSLPFTVLVLTGFFRSLPGALREAAILDGCSEFGVFYRIMMPLARPGLLTVAIFNFMGLWNEYILALVFVNSDAHKTLPLGLSAVSIQAQYKTDFGLMFAGLAIVLLPTLVVYTLLQRQLTKGITVGALKG
jgi:ABC-type glycerol-3-phosphate transport system permease component